MPYAFCWYLQAHSASIVEPQRRRWPFSGRKAGTPGVPLSAAAGSGGTPELATADKLQRHGSSNRSSSLWSRAKSRSLSAAASLTRAASLSRHSRAAVEQQQQQQGFEIPSLHAAVMIEAAKAAMALGPAGASDLMTRAVDVLGTLMADQVRKGD